MTDFVRPPEKFRVSRRP